MADPVPCFVAGRKGYVWDADGAMRLRKKHRIMGCLVGSVAQFKNQNEVNYLPLELSADEVTLAARQGWIELFPETAAPVRSAAERAAAAARAAALAAAAAAATGRSEADVAWDEAYHEYYSQFDPRVGFTGRFLPLLGPKRRKLEQQQPSAGAQHPRAISQQPEQEGTTDVDQNATAGAGKHGVMDAAASAADCKQPPAGARTGPGGGPGVPRAGGDGGTGPQQHPAAAAEDCSEQGWRAAVVEGGSYTLPLTAARAAAARAGLPASTRGGEGVAGAAAQASQTAAGVLKLVLDGRAGAAADGALSSSGVHRVGWSYPGTPDEQLRFDVFCDLHRQGYMMTGGIKFGADMLAYPGDPSLYHAQFTVRPVARGTALNPMVLKAAARGSHAARKHMLLAFYDETNQGGNAGGQDAPRIKYMSFAPEAGFGSKA